MNPKTSSTVIITDVTTRAVIIATTSGSNTRKAFPETDNLISENIACCTSGQFSRSSQLLMKFAKPEMGKEEALAMVTLNNAKILGIDERCGSLEKDKDANIVVSKGDLLDMLGNDVVLAFINGRSIDLDNKHKMLYRRFQEKYKR